MLLQTAEPAVYLNGRSVAFGHCPYLSSYHDLKDHTEWSVVRYFEQSSSAESQELYLSLERYCLIKFAAQSRKVAVIVSSGRFTGGRLVAAFVEVLQSQPKAALEMLQHNFIRPSSMPTRTLQPVLQRLHLHIERASYAAEFVRLDRHPSM